MTQLNKYIYTAFLTFALILSITVYFQYDSIKTLESEVNNLEITVQEKDLLNAKLKKGLESQLNVNKKVNEVNQEMKAKMNVLKTHDLEAIAKRKPKLLEKRMNDATDKIFKSISCYSDTTRVCE